MTAAADTATTPSFEGWREHADDTLWHLVTTCMNAASIGTLEAEEIDFQRRVERARRIASDVTAVAVIPRDAALPAAALPAALRHTHTLTEARAVTLCVLGDATGDVLAWWPEATRITIIHPARGMDQGWANVQWPPGTTAKRHADGGEAADFLAREEGCLARHQRHMAHVRRGTEMMGERELALVAAVRALPYGRPWDDYAALLGAYQDGR